MHAREFAATECSIGATHVARSHRSSLPFALVLPRHYVRGEGKKMKGKRICRYDTRLKELSRHVRGGDGM